MRKCRLCGSLIRRKTEFCRFCTAPQTGARATVPDGVAMGAMQGSAPHWMPVGVSPDTPTNDSAELTLPTAAEPAWTPEPVEPRDAIVVDELEAQLLATDVERATERRDYRERTMATPSLEIAPPTETDVRLPDPSAPAAPAPRPDPPPVKVVATGTASADERNHDGNGTGHANGNGSGTRNGQANRNGVNGSGTRNGNGNGHANSGGTERIEPDEDLVGFAHFPDATAGPKVRWG